MMRILSYLLFLLFLSFESKAQLDPIYFTTYANADFTESYIIYLPEDEVSDCFWVEYEKFDNYQSVFGETGLGTCESGSDKMKIILESSSTEKTVSFGRDEKGLRYMKLHNANGSTQMLSEVIESEEFTDENAVIEDVFYTADNGNILVIFDDEDGLGFTLSGPAEKACDENQMSGILTSLDATGVLYEYQDGSCYLKLEFSEDKVIITDKNCKMKGSCPAWSGHYFFGE